jgi:hypothetical protein
LAAGTEAARQRLRRAAEKSVGQDIVGRTEVGVVEDIEELSSEAEVYLLLATYPLVSDR